MSDMASKGEGVITSIEDLKAIYGDAADASIAKVTTTLHLNICR